MMGWTRLYARFNSKLTYSKLSRFPALRRDLGSKNLKLLRCQSTLGKGFEGPGLKDFIAKEAFKENKELINENNEIIPYLDELDYNGRGRKVFFVTHGCVMNVNDVEIVWSILQKHGYEKTDKEREAEIVLVMTCAIRESSEAKAIYQLVKYRHKSSVTLGILGCMAERLKEKLLEGQNAADLVAGPDSYRDLPRLLALTRNDQKAVNVLLSLDETYADITPVKINKKDPFAFVSIMRGCDNMCTYCIVPFTRGRERSRPMQTILDEVKKLSDQGIRQVTLLGQNVNSYRDLSLKDSGDAPSKLTSGFKTVYKPKIGGIRFDVLLDKVSQINPNMRIRFTSPHPKDFPDEVLYLIRDRKNICCSLHLPAQCGSNAVLERMRRGHTVEAYLELVERIRSIVPNICFSTDIIVGFCGETEKDFEGTLELLRKVKFAAVYFFPYSMREKTTAHRRYVDDVPKEVKIQRVMRVKEVVGDTFLELRREFINQTQLILIEGISKKNSAFCHGRNDGNCSVVVPCCEVPIAPGSTVTRPMKTGDYVAVQITGTTARTLEGKPLYHTTLVDFDESEHVGDPRKMSLLST